ncbi:MAG: CHASE4 domain-containing protein [Methanoregula sp.]
MNLRNRSLLIIFLIFFAIFLIIAVVSFNVTLSGLDRIEYAATNEGVTQVMSSITAESQTLMSTTQDWGWWDDMASFAVNHNQDFVIRNANPNALSTVKVHLIMILDPDGNILFDQLLSPDFTNNTTVPDDIVTSIRNNPRLIHHTADDPGTTGILLLPEGPILISSVPIMPSDKSGAPRGTLIMARYIESGPLQRIQGATGFDVTFQWQGKTGADPEQFGAIEHQMTGKNLYLVVNNASTVTGYGAVREIAGKNIVIGVTMQRDVYQAGLVNVYTYLFLLLLWAIMTGIIVLIVIDRTVLRRINLLSTRVRNLENDREDTPSPVLEGDDELAVLERDILASRASLRMSERELRGFMNAIPDPAAMYTADGTILFANNAFAAYLNKRPEELKGKTMSALLSGEELRKYNDSIQELFRTKMMVQSENEIRGKTLLEFHYPVLDAEGNIARIGLLTFDISERKRLEIALQKVTKKVTLLNTVIFNDIQNKVFVQLAYLEFLISMAPDTRIAGYLEKEKVAVNEIQASLEFAKQYNDMGMNPPRWQNVAEVMLYAVSHIDLGSLKQDFRLKGLEIYADTLLERVFFSIIKNVHEHASTATVIHAGYTVTENGAIIFIEDDGPGIPAEAKEHIFEKGGVNRGAVGLFLSREILSITGITIRETGDPGKGARFEITVPNGSFRIYSGD